jgi:hypothetical protein
LARTERVLPLAYEERPFSHLLRVAIIDDGIDKRRAHFFLKVFKPKPADEGGVDAIRRRVVHEFETTQRIYKLIDGKQRLGVVRPIACYPEHLAIVTEQAAGRTLLAHLQTHAAWWPRKRDLRNLAKTMVTVGRWLRAFQLIDSRPGQISVAELRSYIDLRLRRLVGAGVFSEQVRGQLLSHIDALGREVSEHDLKEVIVHADMAPSNVLVCCDRVVVLDFAMTSRGGVFHDLSRVFSQLDLLGMKPQFRPDVIRWLQRALLRGFDPALTPERPLFRLMLMLHRVNHLLTLSLRGERLFGTIYSWHVRRQHRRWIAAELRGGGAGR